MHPQAASSPVRANFPSEKLTIGAGVAIFHIASRRAVVCYHSRDKYWFLPKGRRNTNEETTGTAEREGFEESGYRCRVLPLPIKHRQTDSEEGHLSYVTEPLWTQLLPLTSTSQYLLFWYAAETVPFEVEETYAVREGYKRVGVYQPPVPFPADLTMQQRIVADTVVGEDGTQTTYEPVQHEGTGVNDEELLYHSYLLPIDDVRQKLKGTVMEDVVRRGWQGIQLRLQMESQGEATR